MSGTRYWKHFPCSHRSTSNSLLVWIVHCPYSSKHDPAHSSSSPNPPVLLSSKHWVKGRSLVNLTNVQARVHQGTWTLLIRAVSDWTTQSRTQDWIILKYLFIARTRRATKSFQWDCNGFLRAFFYIFQNYFTWLGTWSIRNPSFILSGTFSLFCFALATKR
jgi:hypothetical protein